MAAASEPVSVEKGAPSHKPDAPVNGREKAHSNQNIDPIAERMARGKLVPAQGPLKSSVLQRAQRLYGNRAVQQIVQQANGPIQRKSSDKATPPEESSDLIPGGGTGRPLDADTRMQMETRFRRELGGVRVHDDPQAEKSAAVLSAEAYTVGRDIYFARGRYAPASDDGKRLLAHEIAHTVQQDDGQTPVARQYQKKTDPPPSDPLPTDTDDPLEKQADQAGDDATKPDSETQPETPAVDGPAQKTLPSQKPQKQATPPAAKATPTTPGAAPADLSGAGAPKQQPKPIAKKAGAGVANKAGVGAAPPAPAPTVPPRAADGPTVLNTPDDLTNPLPVPPGTAAASAKYDPMEALAEVEADLSLFAANAEQRKNELRTAADQAKASIAADALQQQDAIGAQAAESVAAIRTSVKSVRDKVQADALQAKAIIAAMTAAAFAKVLASTAEENKAILASADLHKKAAADAVARIQTETRAFGVSEGKRGKAGIDGQSQEAMSRGQKKAAGYPKDDRGEVQAEAVMKMASEVSQKLLEPGPDIESTTVSAGKDLADGLDGGEKEVQKAIGEQAPKITEEVEKKSIELGTQFDNIRTEATKGVDDFVAEVNQHLDEVEASAVSQIQALEKRIVAQIGASANEAGGLIDSETVAVISSIDSLVASTSGSARKIKRPHPEGVRAAIGKAETTVDRTASAFLANLNAAGSAAHSGFTEGGTAVVKGIADINENVAGDLGKVQSSSQAGIEAISNKVKDGTDKVVEAWSISLKGAHGEADKAWDSAVAGMEKELQKGLATGKAKMTAQVDEAVQKNREPLDQLESRMEEVAKEARDKYDSPWYEKAGRWVLHAVWSFIKAVFWFIVIVVALVVAIILIIVGFVFDVVALIVIGIVILVAAIGFILYGAIKGWIARVKSAENVWEGAWAGIVGVLDIVGIPGVIEGIIQHDIVNGRRLTEEEAGDRFGSGLLGVLLLILPLKAKGGAPVPEPRIPVDMPIPKDFPAPLDVPVVKDVPAPADGTVPKGVPAPGDVPVVKDVPAPGDVPVVKDVPAPTDVTVPKDGTPPSVDVKPGDPAPEAKVADEAKAATEAKAEDYKAAADAKAEQVQADAKADADAAKAKADAEQAKPDIDDKPPSPAELGGKELKFPKEEFPDGDPALKQWPPPAPTTGAKPKWNEPGGTRYRYDRYRYQEWQKGRSPESLKSPEEYFNDHIEPKARGQSPGEGGSPNHKAAVDKVRNDNGLGTETVGSRRPDAVGLKDTPVKIAGQVYTPRPGARVLYEADNFFKDGSQIEAEGRAQVRQLRADNPNDTIVVEDADHPGRVIVYEPGTQPPPPARLKPGTSPTVPFSKIETNPETEKTE